MSLLNHAIRRHALMRSLVATQIVMQVGMAITPFYATQVQAAESPFSADRQKTDSDNFQRVTASNASSIGQALQSGDLRDMATQRVSGMATQQVQQWLNNFGTARIEFGTDRDFKPKNGSADLLIPLYKSDKHLFFTQNGIRNLDGQITGNFGLGQRYFTESWMMGYNAFYDQNFSRGHKRIGAGLEAWRDYLKLSGNGYYRLSDWRNSGDVEDYDARPANGFDLRAETWLPSYPALGGRIMFEQYYGEEVALFGKDKRQRNPNALTAGLNWTPVPLVSFNADHKRGGSQNEMAFGLQLNWQLGQSLQSQLDPSAIGFKRTLAGSGMDLVERNNNIVLEYRKQEVIKLDLPLTITGVSTSTQTINYKLTSKYGLAQIAWGDAEIIAAGGKIIDAGNGSFQIQMPKYIAGAANTYTLNAIAYDTRQNASKKATSKIIVTPPLVSATRSKTVAASDTIIANGKSTTEISLFLFDESDIPVSGLAGDLSTLLSEQVAAETSSKAKKKNVKTSIAQPARVSKLVEKEHGIYIMTLTAANRSAMASVTPMLGKMVLPAVSVNQISDAESAEIKQGDLKLTADNIVASGVARAQVKARVTDSVGNPVAGLPVAFSLSGSAQIATDSKMEVTTDKDGNAEIFFTDTVAEIVTVTASVNGHQAQLTATFIADSQTATLDENSLAADRSSAIADGKDKITFTAKILDAHRNPVPNIKISWSADEGVLSDAVSTSGADGLAKTTLTSLKAVNVITSVSLNDKTLSADPVNFTADAGNIDPTLSTLNAVPATIVADGKSASQVTLALKDINGNPVSGQNVSLLPSFTGSLISALQDNNDGTYTATLTGTQAGNESVTVNIGGAAFAVAPAAIALTADADNLDANRSTLSAAPSTIMANGVAQSLITFTLKDIHENPVSGQNVSFIATLNGTQFGTAQDNGDGTYTAALTGTKAGNEQVSVNIASSAFGAAPTNITLTADTDNLDATRSALNAAPATIVANGSMQSLITFTLKDIHDNLVSGQNVSFTSTLNGSTISTVQDVGNGSYTATLTGTKAGSDSITANINGAAFGTSPASVVLTADADNLDAARSTLSAAPATLVADGTSASQITLILKDANDNLVSGQNVSFVASFAGTTISTAQDNGDGSYTATLKGTQAGDESISVNIGGTRFGITPAAVTLTADASKLDATKSSLTAAPASIVANGSAQSLITLILKDINSNPVSGQSVTFTGTFAESTISAVQDKGNGVYTATVTGTKAGQESISAKIAGAAFGTAPATLELTADAGNLDVTKSSLNAAPASLVANGTATSQITFSLKDVNNNPVSGQDVAFVSTLAGSSISAVQSNNGVYTANLTGTQAGNESISVKIGGTAFAIAAASVELKADADNLDTAKSTLSTSPDNILADGAETSLITLSLKDANNNPVSGQNVVLSSSLSGSSVGATTDNGDGTYSATLSGIEAGNAPIGVTINSAPFGIAAKNVTLKPVPVDLALTIDGTRKNIGETIQLTLTAKRKGTNTLAPHIKVTFRAKEVTNRQNMAAISGELVLDGQNISSYAGVTDASGQLSVSITDPNGTGVKTLLEGVSENGDVQTQDMIFNVQTSPDVATANRWGYMTETLSAGGNTFHRPYLSSEKTGTGTWIENNESWSSFTYSAATAMCSVPSSNDIKTLYDAYPLSGVLNQHGWPIGNVMRTSTLSDGYYTYIYMDNGRISYNSNAGNYGVICQQ